MITGTTDCKLWRLRWVKVMEITQLFNTLGKPGCSYNCKTWVVEGFGFLDGQVSRLKLSTFCDERELKLEMLELDWQFPQSCTDVAGHVSQFLVALILSESDYVQTFSRWHTRWEKKLFQLTRSLTCIFKFVTTWLLAHNPRLGNWANIRRIITDDKLLLASEIFMDSCPWTSVPRSSQLPLSFALGLRGYLTFELGTEFIGTELGTDLGTELGIMLKPSRRVRVTI